MVSSRFRPRVVLGLLTLSTLLPLVAAAPSHARFDGPVPSRAASTSSREGAAATWVPRTERRDGTATAVWPLRPRPAVVERFDPPVVTWGRGHRGVDLAGDAGQPVRATMSGVISFSGRVAGVPVVVVDHGRVRTTYQPVLSTRRRGESVHAGDLIGRLIATGSHCPPRACLHWGLRRGATYLDPLSLVAVPRPVRLLAW